jgi:hypothetical protein
MQHDFTVDKLTHAALTQYYRWYQVYEVPFSKKTIANQKDILADDVEIVTHAGTTKGKDGLEERLKVYEGWFNAHHVQHTEVKQISENELSLEADILYQNIRPDQNKYSYTIHYSAVLQLRENDLPVFTGLRLTPTGEIQEFTFQPAYAENRSKSFMYYWFYLLETLPQSIDKYSELLAADFSIELVDGSLIESEQALRSYFESFATKIKTGIHTFSTVQVKEIEEDLFSVSIDIDWKGISITNENMVFGTRHEWILENTKDERFARLKKMKITGTKPFEIVK